MDYNTNSDDDFDANSNGNSNGYNEMLNNNNQTRNPNGLSKAELRRSNKPIMEKRRRARINHCLNELKSLILEAMKKDPARHTKLEKADILEMTVKHLQSMQRRQLSMAIQTDPTVIHKFKTGFVECADEVKRYIGQLEGVDTGTRQRLSNYLNNCANSLEQIGSFTNFSHGYRSQTTPNFPTTGVIPTQMPFALPQDANNNNGRVQISGVNLIPSLLPTGELALIMPNTNVKKPLDNEPSSFCLPTIPTTNNIELKSNFPRVSAFSKPPSKTAFQSRNYQDIKISNQPSTTNTSPPLSPISSISSQEEDSIMHTSSDFASRSITPPLDGSHSSFSTSFSTPSSSESSRIFSSTSDNKHLQMTPFNEIMNSSKRFYPYGSADEEPTAKKPHTEQRQNVDNNGNIKREPHVEDTTESMWRPW